MISLATGNIFGYTKFSLIMVVRGRYTKWSYGEYRNIFHLVQFYTGGGGSGKS